MSLSLDLSVMRSESLYLIVVCFLVYLLEREVCLKALEYWSVALAEQQLYRLSVAESEIAILVGLKMIAPGTRRSGIAVAAFVPRPIEIVTATAAR